MNGSSTFRRVFHILSPAFLSYFILPDQVGGGITKASLAILFVGTAWCIEIARIALGINLFGMRPYEGGRVSAYAQGTLGLAIGIFLIRQPAIVVPVFLGMAWIDPLAATVRRREWPRAIVGLAYFGLFLGTELLLPVPWPPSWSFLLAAVAMAVALVVEGPKHKLLDDDFLMQVVPYAVLYGIALAFLSSAVRWPPWA
jgi:hypothetical protein